MPKGPFCQIPTQLYMFIVYTLVIINRYFEPSCLGADFLGGQIWSWAELVRGCVCWGPEMSSYPLNTGSFYRTLVKSV